MLGVFTDDPKDTFAFDDLTFVTDFSDRAFDFHEGLSFLPLQDLSRDDQSIPRRVFAPQECLQSSPLRAYPIIHHNKSEILPPSARPTGPMGPYFDRYVIRPRLRS